MGHILVFTISVQSSECNVPLVSGTNMIFDIKNCSNNIECKRLDHNDILLTYFKSTTPFYDWRTLHLIIYNNALIVPHGNTTGTHKRQSQVTCKTSYPNRH